MTERYSSPERLQLNFPGQPNFLHECQGREEECDFGELEDVTTRLRIRAVVS